MDIGKLLWTWLFTVFLLIPLQGNASEGPFILYFNSYHHGYAWSDQITDGIRKELAVQLPGAELHIEYLDSKRRGTPEDFETFRQYCFAKYAGVRPDLILVSDNNGLDFLLGIRDELFPSIPVVFCGINYFSPGMLAGQTGITGIREELSVAETVELGLELFPETSRVVFVSDQTTTGQAIRRQVEETFFWGLYDVRLEVLDRVTRSDLAARLAGYGRETIVLMGNFFVDAAGESLSLRESLEVVTSAAQGPVFTFWEPFMAPGVLGGVLVSARKQGAAAGRMAVNVLRGQNIDTIPVSDGPPNVATLEYSEMQQWDFSRDRSLPPVRVLNRPRSFYAVNKGLVRFVMAFFVVVGAGAVVVLAINMRLRRAESALRESERNYREIFNSTGDAIIMHDARTGRVVDVNETMQSMFGLTRGRARNVDLVDLFGSDGPFSAEDAMARIHLASMGSEQIFEGKNRRFDNGRTFWTETVLKGTEIGGQGRVLAVVRDISRRKRSERERNLLAAAIKEAPVMIMITDATPRIRYVNRAFTEITGYAGKEVLGRNPRILKSGRHDGSFYSEMWQTVLSGKTWRGRIVNMKKDGSIYTEDAVISAVRDETGKIINYIAVKQDVSREIDLEEKLFQAQKMEAVGKLAGGVAHDFNNLLQVIRGFVELALQEIKGEGPERRYLGDVLKAADRAADLVRQLLTFSRKTPLKSEEIDLNGLVGGMLKMIRRVIGEQFELAFSPGSMSGGLRGDPGQIEQVLMNLCVNARDAMPDGGRLEIETFEEEIARGASGAGRYQTLSVTDTGTGIPAEMLDHIFEPFFTSKGVGKGTGLGLATVYAIAERHGGFVDVDTREGVGTSFRVCFPVSRPDPVPYREKGESRSFEPGDGGLVLVAEDDDLVRELAETILSGAGYEVLAARDGEEAVELFAEHVREVSVALVDVVMPKKNGRAVFEELRRYRPDVPVVFSTGYAASALDGLPLSDQSRTALIRKPYRPDELLGVVGHVMKWCRKAVEKQ